MAGETVAEIPGLVCSPQEGDVNLRVPYPHQHGANFAASRQGRGKGALALPGQWASTSSSTAGLCWTCPHHRSELASNPAPELGLIPLAYPLHCSQRRAAADGSLSSPPCGRVCVSLQFPKPMKGDGSVLGSVAWRAGCWGCRPADPRDCQPPALAAAASPCPAVGPCQQLGSWHPDVVPRKSCQRLLAEVSFSPVRVDIFSV